MPDSLVSVIVPTFRRDTVLSRALESLGNQTWLHYEIIVVDDNADAQWNGKVADIVQAFMQRYPAIHVCYVRNETNLGSARTRNAGIQAARGAFICFLDDDDVYLPQRIENQLTAMVQEKADFGITDLYLYNERDQLVDMRKRDYIKDMDQLMRYHLMHHLTGTDTIMFRKDYLTAIGCFDPIDIGDEFYLMTKAIGHGGKFHYLPRCDVRAYVHSAEKGLSAGAGKILGENRLFDYKRQYFTELDRAAIRYIKMRHHAVLAYAYLKNKQFGAFLAEGIKAFLCEPVGAFRVMTGGVK